jgi:adenosylcobinamide-GDP ribazoletransferase
MRGLILAVQFLTRLPTPQVADLRPGELSRAAVWFPLVGALVGSAVAAALAGGASIEPALGAIGALVVWVWITGALHLDGLADLVDALGASHRDPQRFLAVLRDPHVGTFGVIAIVLALATKLILLFMATRLPTALLELALLTAWARHGAVLWALTLPPLSPGSGERFAWHVRPSIIALWSIALVGLSIIYAPVLAVAGPLAIAAWWLFLRGRLGGMTGDCLGAGVELCEIALLAAVVMI